MGRAAVALALVAVLAGCSTQTIRSSSASPSPIGAASLAATPTRTPAATDSTPVPQATAPVATWAVACGTVSDYVRTKPNADGSFVLNSPGRSPLKVTVPVARVDPTEGAFGGYVCAGLLAGVPYPISAGLIPPNTELFVEDGTYPATKAKPAPVGFVLPQNCAYVVPPAVGGDQSSWKVDCGTSANRAARATLGAPLRQQGWTDCGPAAGTMRFFKGTLQAIVVESSLAPGDYPVFSEATRPGSGSCAGG